MAMDSGEWAFSRSGTTKAGASRMSLRSRVFVAPGTQRNTNGRAKGTRNRVQDECRIKVEGEEIEFVMPASIRSLHRAITAGTAKNPTRSGLILTVWTRKVDSK